MKMTFEEQFAFYIEVKRRAGLRKGTIDGYRQRYKRYLSVFGDLLINEFNQEVVLNQFDKWSYLPAPTWNELKKQLNTFCNYLVNENILQKNPVRVIRRKLYCNTVKVLAQKEVDQILLEAEGTWLYPKLFFVAASGFRHSETDAMQWNDLDFDKRTATVNRSIQNGVIYPPKTQASYRTNELPVKLFEVLKQQRVLVEEGHGKCKWVFPGRSGQPYSQSFFNVQLKNFIEEKKLPAFTLKSLRHYHATFLAELPNITEEAIKKRMGWSKNSNLIHLVYTHTTEKQLKCISNAINEIFNKGRCKK